MLLFIALAPLAQAQDPGDGRDPHPSLMPDIRGSDLPVAAEKGNFVAVPIPFSNPTLGSGLIGIAAYFHPQTAAQERTQPASVTGIGALYTADDGRAAAIAHAGYWKGDLWRFTGLLGHFDVTLPLLSLGESSELLKVTWGIKGSALSSELSRRVGENWFVGVSGEYVDVEQRFSVRLDSLEFALPDAFEVSGFGTTFRFDTRDMPTNAYDGRYFEATASRKFFRGSDEAYTAYSLAFRSYHSLSTSLVFAWELGGCATSDGVPLWDACNIELRGFPTTDYLGKSSVRGQAEARWLFAKRWGAVAFAGAGRIQESLSGLRNGDVVPSYGLGLRFMVQTAKRINMRLDYGRSTDSRSIYLSVGEAF